VIDDACVLVDFFCYSRRISPGRNSCVSVLIVSLQFVPRSLAVPFMFIYFSSLRCSSSYILPFRLLLLSLTGVVLLLLGRSAHGVAARRRRRLPEQVSLQRRAQGAGADDPLRAGGR
jgi:hypothetical protein